MPGWISELIILVGLLVLAFAVVVGNTVYDFFWGEQYVILHFDRVTMLWIGGLTAFSGLLLRLTDTRPKRRRRTTQEY